MIGTFWQPVSAAAAVSKQQPTQNDGYQWITSELLVHGSTLSTACPTTSLGIQVWTQASDLKRLEASKYQ